MENNSFYFFFFFVILSPSFSYFTDMNTISTSSLSPHILYCSVLLLPFQVIQNKMLLQIYIYKLLSVDDKQVTITKKPSVSFSMSGTGADTLVSP